MKKLLFLILLSLCCYSCSTRKSVKGEPKDSDTLKNNFFSDAKVRDSTKDTTLTFSIEGKSTEGSEVEAHYVNGMIKDAIWYIYGETGKVEIYYQFLESNTIKATEKKFKYRTNFQEINSETDIKMTDSVGYLLDTSGKVLSKDDFKDILNLFSDFKSNVPFRIK